MSDIEQLQERIDALLAAGKALERSHMNLHRYHHGPDCEHCAALRAWWGITLPLEVKKP